MKLIRKVIRKTRNFFLRIFNKTAFEKEFLTVLPKNFHGPARLLFQKNTSSEEKKIGERIEQFRSNVASSGTYADAYAYGSPRPETFQTDQEGHAQPGPIRKGNIEKFMETGTGIDTGLLLRRIVEGLGSKRILELGTNTGFSGCYFLSLPQVEELVTIEGSTVLAEIADQNLSRISKNFRLMVTLFDDALDELMAENQKFDCVFIDGQHEREALLHYINRSIPLLNEGGALIIDDLYWSDDMFNAWQEICQDQRFSQTVNLTSKGVCLLANEKSQPAYFNICDYMGEPMLQYEDRYNMKYS